MLKHIPNILSALRIALIPLIIRLYLSGQEMNAAIVLGISGLTDFLDGQLARRFGWITPLGKVLDPVADKLTLVSICVLLAIKLKHYRIFFVILLIKDLIMILLGGNLLRHGVTLDGARWFGKVATFVFYTGMIVLWLFDLPNGLIVTILSIITLLEVISALCYIPDYLEYREEKAEKKKKA